jgi:hypothetical protein
VWELCLATELGVAEGSGQGVRHPTRELSPWLALAPGTVVRAGTGRFPALLALDIPIPLVRPAFALEGYGDVYRAAAVGVRLSLGVDFVAF